MSLLGPVYVTSVLTLSAKESKALQDVARAAGGIDASLKALVEKLNEPPSEGLTPAQQQQVESLIAQLKASGDALTAAEAAQPPA